MHLAQLTLLRSSEFGCFLYSTLLCFAASPVTSPSGVKVYMITADTTAQSVLDTGVF